MNGSGFLLSFNDPLPKLPTISETILKRRKTARPDTYKKQVEQLKQKHKDASRRRRLVKRPAAFIQENRKAQRDGERIDRGMKRKALYIPDESRLAFVVRVKGFSGMHPKAKQVLQLIGLNLINQGTFIKLNQPMLNLMTVVDPYVVWGYPTLKTVRELLFKRGRARIDGKRKTITDNKMIEDNIGEFGLLCVEDIIHEIFNVGEHFKEVMEFLWPFKLNPPTGGWKKRKAHKSTHEFDCGNRETLINEMVKRMV